MFGNLKNLVFTPAEPKDDVLKEKANASDSQGTEEAVDALAVASKYGNLFYKKLMDTSQTALTELGAKVKEIQSNIPADLMQKPYNVFDEFNKCQSEFEKSKEQDSRLEELAKLAPWDPAVTGLSVERTSQLKAQILNLSKDQRNFLRDIPEEANFDWSEERAKLHLMTAVKVLELDSNLKALRFRLVPKMISEDMFWKNYFYRISLIRQTIQLSELADTSINSDSNDDMNLAEDLRLDTDFTTAKGTVVESRKQSSVAPPPDDSIKSLDELEEELLREIDSETADPANISDDEELEAELAEMEKGGKNG